jgi:hypothetical protein
VAGGALLSSPVVGDFFGGQGAQLDVIQGDTARVRDLAVGFGSLRTVRAETPAAVPQIHADLRLVDGVLKGTIRNDSDRALESPAVVLGGNVVVLADLPAGATAPVSLRIVANQFGQALSDKIFGATYNNAASSEIQRRNATRHRIIDQLTYDPMFGNLGQLPSDGPVVLAWGRDTLLQVDVQGQKPARSANILYYVPLQLKVSGITTFRADLVRSTVLESDAVLFSKEPSNMNFGQGSVTIAYRPIPFEGTFTATKVLLGLGFGGDIVGVGKPIAPIPAPSPEPSPTDGQPGFDGWDGLPEIEVFDRTTATWQRLPHFAQGTTYSLADPGKYVDEASGTIQVKFVNDRQDSVGFAFSVALEGIVQ